MKGLHHLLGVPLERLVDELEGVLGDVVVDLVGVIADMFDVSEGVLICFPPEWSDPGQSGRKNKHEPDRSELN